MSREDFDLSWGDLEEPETTADTLQAVDTGREQQRAAGLAQRIAAAVEAARPDLDKIPDPAPPAGDGNLTAEEKETLEACIGGVRLLSTAHWIAGKALDTIATGRLFREIPHKLEPDRYYRTIEEWARVEHGISQSRCSKLRAAWPIAQALAALGHDAPEGQVRELVPLAGAHGVKAAVGLYVLAAQHHGPDKITAERLRELVKLLPGDLALTDDDDPETVARTLQGAVLHSKLVEAPEPAVSPDRIRRSADRRAVELANRLGRGRIPRTEVTLYLLEAFADETDTTVFNAVLARMKKAPEQ